MSGEGLFVGELLKEVYDSLIKENSLYPLELDKSVSVEVANDNDYPNDNRIGYLLYDEFNVCSFNNKSYLLCLALNSQGYAARNYEGDLTSIVIKNEGLSQKELISKLEKSTYLQNSLLHGVNDGNIGLRKNQYGERLFNLIKSDVQNITLSFAEYDKNYIDLSRRGHVCTKPTLYKREAVKVFSDAIFKVLGK